MSILKSILHRWNSTNKEYDTLHPETEAAQVTDWHESIIGSLASKVLPTVVSELTTDSVFGKLMSLLLSASGVKYSLGTNGYVKFGSFFGGLIIQWVYLTFKTASSQTVTLPIAINSLYAAVGGDSGDGCLSTGAWVSGSTLSAYSTWTSGSVGIWYVVIGS